MGDARGVSDDRLIVALDFATAKDARTLVTLLGDDVCFYKVGHELLFDGGIDLARALKSEGKRVFLDMKFLDIANTVERSVAQAAETGVDFLTIHGHDSKTLAAAARGRVGGALKVLAVTVLTSLTEEDVAEQGIARSSRDLVAYRARLARQAGVDGVIASGEEAALIRNEIARPFLIVTPGIRLAGDTAGDQARVTTPAAALRAGADHLVVGRPISRAGDPRGAVARIKDELAAFPRILSA